MSSIQQNQIVKEEEEDNNEDDRVVLNVGGVKFEVSRSTLLRYPGTKLGQIHTLRPDKRGEYFFDRNPKLFEVILDFYRTGKMVIADEISLDKMREELRFFQIEWDDPEDPRRKGKNAEEQEDEEDHDERILQTWRPERVFYFAFPLLMDRKKTLIWRGIRLLEGLDNHPFDESQENRDQSSDFLDNSSVVPKTSFNQISYYLGYAYHRLGNSVKARESLSKIFKNQQQKPIRNNEDEENHDSDYYLDALALQTLIDDKALGMARLGVITLAASIGVAAILIKNGTIGSILSKIPSILRFSSEQK